MEDLDAGRSQTADRRVPFTPVEEVVVALWEEVLDRSPIRPTDRIFDLGAHSILIARAAARLEALSGVRVPLDVFFEYPVLADFAREISRDEKANHELTSLGLALAHAALENATARQSDSASA
jgi:hypothetical protein